MDFSDKEIEQKIKHSSMLVSKLAKAMNSGDYATAKSIIHDHKDNFSNHGDILQRLEKEQAFFDEIKKDNILNIDDVFKKIDRSLENKNDLDEAILLCKKILNIRENDVKILSALIHLFYNKNKFNQCLETIELLEKIKKLDKNILLIKLNCLVDTNNQTKYDKIYNELYDELNYDFDILKSNYYRYFFAGDMVNAQAQIDVICNLYPEKKETYHSQAHLSLIQNHYKMGFEHYELRKEIVSNAKSNWIKFYKNYSGKEITSLEEIKNKNVIVIGEQGFGDHIMIARYMPMLKEVISDCRFLCTSKLRKLLQSNPKLSILSRDEKFDYEYKILVGSLPRLFGTEHSTVPAPIPYLFAQPERAEKWQDAIGNDGFKIGIAWQGNPASRIDIGRSFPVSEFASLAAMRDVRLISLQKNHGLEQLTALPPRMRVETLGTEFDSGEDAFLDSAAVMMGLDLIITSDTSIAHLAGALGRPVFVVLKKVPDWRWGLDGDTTPWYPTAKLFRQTEIGDWRSAFSQVENAVQKLIKDKCKIEKTLTRNAA